MFEEPDDEPVAEADFACQLKTALEGDQQEGPEKNEKGSVICFIASSVVVAISVSGLSCLSMLVCYCCKFTRSNR